MNLLPLDRLVQTSRVDHADWNYRPLLGYVSRSRFALVLELLPQRRVARLLEIGYGSGIFMPELAHRCDELYGIDAHPAAADVSERLGQCGVHAHLSQQNIAGTNFPGGYFDAIVAVSALEFVDEISAAARELARLLAPGGSLVAVMPGTSPLLDLMLRLATNESAQRDYGQRRQAVLPALLQYFRLRRRKAFGPVYRAYEFEALREAG